MGLQLPKRARRVGMGAAAAAGMLLLGACSAEDKAQIERLAMPEPATDRAPAIYDLWQGQMVNLDRLKQNYEDFVQAPSGDFLIENSFRIKKFDTELKAALSSEPTAVNSLLYRSYKTREDFEEDTFLDLYIFQ